MELSNANIIHDDDPRIRSRSRRVALPLSEEDRDLLQAMYQYVSDSQDDELCEQKNLSPAVGLAAIQVGEPRQMIAVVIPDEEGNRMEWALANPKIVSKSVRKAYLKGGEGCLSVPDEHPGPALRSQHIKVKAYDLLSDQEVLIEARDYAAIVLQHEIDHLSGTLFYDRIVDPTEIPPNAIEIE